MLLMLMMMMNIPVG